MGIQDQLGGGTIMYIYNPFDKTLVKKNNKLPIYKKLVDLLIKIQKIKPKSKLQSI